MASPRDIESDDDFGYDLSLEDEQLLATLADDASTYTTAPAPAVATATAAAHDVAPNLLRSSPTGKTVLRAVGRTHSVDVFVQGTQPYSAPSVVPVDSVEYPDRKHLPLPPICAWPKRTYLTDDKGISDRSTT